MEDEETKTLSRSKVVHFSLTIVGVGDCLDEAFFDAVCRLREDPASTIFGEVDWQGDGRSGDFRVVLEDAEPPLADAVMSMFGVEKAEA